MIETVEKTFFFAEFELDTAKRRLLKDGQPLALNPKAFDLLTLLVKNHGQILSKEELLETVWEGQFVEENNLSVHISALRKIFGEKKGEHRFIVTVPGKGYKFVAEIRNGDESSPVKVTDPLPNQSPKFADGETIIGRAAEIAEIKNLLGNEALGLITLTGAGGAGKTSLAQIVGNELKTDFADGVFFVELAAVRDAQLVAPTIMQTLGANEADNQNFAEVLRNFLRERKILLILDNFEQIAAAAPLVGELLESSAKLRILITSRVALRLENETEFPVKPLSVPPLSANLSFEKLSGYAAVELFIKRAAAVKPNFTLNRENAKAIAGICHRLDGLPLAVELAAARVKLLSPESIFTRLESSLNLLTGGAKELPEHQQTMRGTIRWSYELLDEEEKKLFRRLAVFAGGLTVEAAESVVGGQRSVISQEIIEADDKSSTADHRPPTTVLDLLTSLVQNNLLTLKEQENDDARLQMLEVVREFSAESLENSGEAEKIRRRHAEFFLRLAEETEPLLLTEKVVTGLEKLDAEHDNLRAALRWLLTWEIEMMVRMTAALRQFWYNRCYLTEARQWLETALAKSDVKPNPTRLKLLNAFSLVTRTQGDYAATRRASEESLTGSREIKDLRQIILACHAVAGLEIRENNLAAARKLYEESLLISRELTDERQIAFTLSGLSNVLLNEGKVSAARPLLDEALIISRRMGFKFNLSTDLINLGAVNYYEGDADAAYRNFAESLAIAREIKSTAYISCCLDGFAAVAAISKIPEQAARLAGAAESLRQSIGYEIEPTERIFRDDYLVKTRSALDEKTFIAAYQKGKTLDLNEAVALAESSFSALNERETEIIIETHKLERVVIEEEIKEYEPAPKSVKELTGSNEKPAVSIRRRSFAVIIGAVLVSAAIGGYFWLNAKSSNGVPFLNSGVRQLTTSGKVGLAAVSPDGKSFAYTTSDLGQKSLWLGYVDGGNHLQLRPAADAVYYDLIFSPDGSRLYFSYSDDKNPKAALYKMPAPGGVAEKILDEITNFSLSPDGGKIAFSHNAESQKETLVIADLNTAEKREVVSLPKSTFLSAINAATISWSPDGKRLAFASAENDSFKSDIATVEISSGKIRRIKSDVWREISKTAWMADGNSLIITAVGANSWSSVVRFRILQLELPSGKTHDVTTDRSNYGESLSLSAKSDLLLSIEHRQLNNIWIAPAENLGAARQLTNSSFGKYDGLWGMDFTPDGKIIYTSSDTESQFISQMNADGTEQKQLTASGLIDSVLNVSNDGRYIVFHSNRSGGFDIWRMNADGGNPVQLTFGRQNYQPFVSADNAYVYYKSWENGAGELRRVSIDGGKPEILGDKETSWLSFSPDGKYFAAARKTDQSRLAIFLAATNQLVEQFDIPKGGTLSMGSRWTPDSLAVVYRDNNFGYWKQSIHSGEARRLEGLPKEKFYNFAFSKDGKWFAFVRGQEIRDVIMIGSNR